MADIDLAGLLQKFLSDYSTARTERGQIYKEGEIDLSKAIQAYQPGGGAMSGALQAGMAPVEQDMVSRGLSGTTRPGAVRAGMAADIEAQRMQGLAEAKTAKAQFGAGFEDIYPTAGLLSHLATGGFGGILSREIAEAQAKPGYASRVDYGTQPADMSYSGGSAGGGGSAPSGTDKYTDQLFDQLDGGDGDGGGGGGGMDIGGLGQGGYIDWTRGLRGTNRAAGIFIGPWGPLKADPTSGLVQT